ncbi:MAG TPA: asparagine synthase (glutamine-hydrolyzing) [Bacteroidia bacterium]|jgi:asparagine synthase (glutamine-hydrolysing)|nr:asparagine synthase (glutamine-hydrolyzing) [Bacteroidia bacterium]
MCGITGVIAFTDEGKKYLDRIGDAVKSLRHRGPDGEGIFRDGNVAFGHTRLAIIDTSDLGAQPFTSNDRRYTIVLNGEIFNYRELRAELEKEGVKFRSQTDTEVLLELFAREKEKCLPKLNGFFAFAIYDKNDGTVFLARDRFGEKPLVYYFDTDVLIFGSEHKALFAFGIPRSVSLNIVADYLHLNYVPQYSDSTLEQIYYHKKGVYTTIDNNSTSYANSKRWYALPDEPENYLVPSYSEAVRSLKLLLEKAVTKRLIADVPLGSFLSGGLDSSIITALAAKHKTDLHTFSIGFAEEKLFDETEYAELVSKHLRTSHHVFSLTNNDLLESLHEFLDNCDEPFADSSALALNILAKQTKGFVTVALSGDGADELFGGYNKHEAELRIRSKDSLTRMAKKGSLLWNILPASRNSVVGNRVRQLRKFAEGSKLSIADRYWKWAGFASKQEIERLLVSGDFFANEKNKKIYTEGLHSGKNFNEILRADMQLVLEGDMLVKVDRMSMLHGLEVRPPFLDHEVVDLVMQLPADYKIQPGNRKRILKDAFADLLPKEIYTRKKQGFEVPLLKWFRSELSGMIGELLNEKFLEEQNIFNPAEVQNIRRQLHSSSPGDSAARIWGLIVFQYWWKKYIQK